VSRALMAKPKLLILDEPSLGLAPSTAQDVYAAIARLRADSGISMLVVEQNANLAFRIVDSAVVLETGRSVLTGTTAELKGNDEIRKAYLGGCCSTSILSCSWSSTVWRPGRSTPRLRLRS